MSENIIQEYDTKLDNKHRCVIHGIPAFDRYHVTIFESGRIEMTPRVLASPDELSEKTLKMIYGSIKNLKEGQTGSAVDFDECKEFLKDNE